MIEDLTPAQRFGAVRLDPNHDLFDGGRLDFALRAQRGCRLQRLVGELT